MKESDLYLLASLSSLVAFLVCTYYIINKKSLNFETTIILVLGLLSLSKSIEYYEKYDYKLSKNL